MSPRCIRRSWACASMGSISLRRTSSEGGAGGDCYIGVSNDSFLPHPEERHSEVYAACVDLAAGRVSKDGPCSPSWLETAQDRLLTRGLPASLTPGLALTKLAAGT